MASPSATKYPYPSSEIDVWNFVDNSLTGNNYKQWRQQMHNLIEDQGLVGFVNGTIEAPPEKDSKSENYRSWKRSDDLLQKWIRTTLTEGICKEVKHVRTAKRLWTKLEKWFGKPIIITSSSMASSSSSASRNSSSAIVGYPAVVSEFVKQSLSVSENNYSGWRQQMYSLIKSEGLVDLVSGAVKAPAKRVTITLSDAAGCGDKAVKEIENEHYISWKISDDKLREWIRTTLSTDIPEHVVRSGTAKSMWTKLVRIFGHYAPLHKAAIEGDWEMANEFIEQEPDIAIRADITGESETMLMVAVRSKRRNNFVKKLVEHMSPEDLAVCDTKGKTALHGAARAGNIEATILLVNKNPYLPNAQTYVKQIPLFFAAARGHRDMVLYLLSVTTIDDDDDKTKPKPSTNHLSRFLAHSLSNANHLLAYSQNPKLMEDGKRKGIDDHRWNPTPFDGESGFRILHELINNGFHDIALALLQDKPELAVFIPEKEKDLLDYHSLMAIARKPSSFLSGASFNFFQNEIYLCVPLKLENITEHKSKPDIENAANGCIYGLYSVKNRFHAVFWEVIENYVPWIKHIRQKKMEHHKAHELLKFICTEIVKSNYSSVEKIFSPPLFQAISAGILEIVEVILRSYPNAISFRNHKKQSIFHHAVVCRHENVFNLIHQVEEPKTIFFQLDESKNNALHLAGYLAPQERLSLIPGAGLQMQRELQWYKEVEKHVVPRNEERNREGMTPAEVFTNAHKELVKEGEQWMKNTANACSIVAALIATVAFAAAITVPGGNNGDGGPIFNKRASFLIFGIFDAFALFSSITSLLFFLSILTSRYAEEDFLVALPRRLIFCLLTLFLSILSTMIAFGATLYLVFEESYKAWIIILIFVLPGIPLWSCRSPLLLAMFKSTYWSIFRKQSDDMLY